MLYRYLGKLEQSKASEFRALLAAGEDINWRDEWLARLGLDRKRLIWHMFTPNSGYTTVFSAEKLR